MAVRSDTPKRYPIETIGHEPVDLACERVDVERCARAAGTAGRILIIEPVRGRDADTGIDLAMMVFFGGRERSQSELTELATSHHLALNSTTAVAADRTLLEFTPPR